MSLLMEALKSAERRKQIGPNPPPDLDAGAEDEAPPNPEPEPPAEPETENELDLILLSDEEPEPPTALALESVPELALDSSPPPPAPSLPAAEEELPPAISAPPAPSPPPPQKAAPPPLTSQAASPISEPTIPAQQRLAETVFTSKRTGSGRNRRMLLWGGIAVLTLLAAAYPGYLVWQELHPQALYLGPPPSARPAPETPPLAAPAEPSPPPMTASLPASDLPARPAPDLTPPPAIVLPPPKPAPEVVPPASAPPAAIVPPTPTPPSKVVEAPSPTIPAPGSGVKIIRTTQGDPLTELAAGAYAAFLEGSLREANEKYQAMLQADPNNRDALLGLAAIANKKGLAEEALRLYTRLLELDPSDGLAQAGVLAFSVDSPQNEGRIKTLLNRLPESDFLYFVLGNLYSRQGRWPEAEQAFYQACQRNRTNPDYAFNLAVSLDHLRQGKTAQEHYRQALALAEHRPAAFDQVQAWKRLQELSLEESR